MQTFAADALDDLVETSLLDLPWQEGIGDRGTRGADDVEPAASNRSDHRVWTREAADPDDRLRRERADRIDPRALMVLRQEARRARVLPPLEMANHEVPEVDERIDQLDEGRAVLRR